VAEWQEESLREGSDKVGEGIIEGRKTEQKGVGIEGKDNKRMEQ
jgi:hypothetical protein